MLAVVKTPRIDLRIEGEIPARVIAVLRDEYDDLRVWDDDEAVPIKETRWYKDIRESATPGEILRARREIAQMTQAELGEKVGISRQNISNLELGRRPIGQTVAKRLADALGCRPDEFQHAWR